MSFMRVLILILNCLIFHLTLVAQSYDPAKVGKKAAALYSQAIEKAENGQYREAILVLDEALKADKKFVDAYLSKGGLFGELKDYANAIVQYEQAFAIDPQYSAEYKLPYSINLAGAGRFKDALAAAENFLAMPGLSEASRKAGMYRKQTYVFALEQEKIHADAGYEFQPVNLGDSVNSEVSEYYPSLTIDGRTLVYTRRVRNFNEDFFVSTQTGGQWSAAASLSGDINTEQNEGAQHISQDGEWLIFTGCNFPDGIGNCDLYYSIRTKNGWSLPKNMGPTINTEFWESAPCLSPDKRELYFASRAAGGIGGIDLYVSTRQPNGQWSKPENLGPGINTPGDESCPFLHADNQTLYFTSNGHPGYGGDDLFVCRRQKDGTWSRPENLGYPINTIEHEGSLVIASDGQTAYYASDKSDSRGGLDIFSFKMRKDVSPLKTVWIQGRVFDVKTGAGLPSAVELINLEGGRTISKVQTDEMGHYMITLPLGSEYVFNVNRKGYLFYSGHYSMTSGRADSTYRADIPLQPIELNALAELRNIFFETGQYTLRPESFTELDLLLQLLRENPNLRIQINGHTDNIGRDPDNQTLSENRAGAVVTYLVSKGIDKARLKAKGFGASKPLASNQTEEGRSKNRRTEVLVISK